MPVWIRVRRPLSFAHGLRSIGGASPREGEAPDVAVLGVANFAMDRLSELFDDSPSEARIATRLDPAYLRWRYGQAPLLDYRVVTEETDGALAGAAFFRVRPRGRLWETTLGDVIVRPGDRRTARRLIGQVISAAKVDHVTCHFPTGSAQLAAARARGFLRWSRGEVFVVNALDPGLAEAVATPDAWSLSLGTLEVF